MVRIFHHYLPRSLVLLAATQILIFLMSPYLSVQVNSSLMTSELDGPTQPLFSTALIFAGVMFLALMASGFYWNNQRRRLFGTLARVTLSFVLGALIFGLLDRMFSLAVLPAEVWLDALLIGFVGVLSAHIALHALNGVKRRILVIGRGNAARRLAGLEGADFEIVGFVPVSDSAEKQSEQDLLGLDTTLLDLINEHDIREIVVAFDDRRKAMPNKSLLDCKLNGITITDVTTFFEHRFGKIDLKALNYSNILFSDGFRVTPQRFFLKRAFDVGVCLLLLSLVWPVLITAMAAILIESGGRGSIFYTQMRVGKRGKIFKMYKLRSMQPNAEKPGAAQYAQKIDARITKVGRIIRCFRIDELPQLVNVLRGEMSFVGPRPERPEFVERYVETIPYYGLRHEINPGITGWAQISYPYGSSEYDAIEKLQYDLYYLKNFSIILDLNILFQTVHAVVLGSGAR